MIHSVVVTGDHFQILVGDSRTGPMIDTTHLWDLSTGIAQLPNQLELIGIPTARYGGRIIVGVELLPDHAVTCSGGPEWSLMGEFLLCIQSGEMIFWGPELEDFTLAPRIVCHPGTYNGAAFSSTAAEIVDEFVPEGPDRYWLRMSKIT